MEELYLGLCYSGDQGYENYEGSNEFLKKVSQDFGEKPYDVCSDDDDMMWVVFKSTPEKIFNYLSKFGVDKTGLDEVGSFYLKPNGLDVRWGWVRDEETLEDCGWELKDGGDYSMGYDPDTLDLYRERFDLAEEDEEDSAEEGLESRDMRLIGDIDEFNERVVKAYNSLKEALGRDPHSSDILESLQEEYDDYEDADYDPRTYVSYLNAIDDTLREAGLAVSDYVDSAEEACATEAGLSSTLDSLSSKVIRIANSDSKLKGRVTTDKIDRRVRVYLDGNPVLELSPEYVGVKQREFPASKAHTGLEKQYSASGKTEVIYIKSISTIEKDIKALKDLIDLKLKPEGLSSTADNAESFDPIEKEIYEAMKKGRTNIL